MSLGQAFIDIHARTAGFAEDLRKLQPELDALQAKTNAALAGASTTSRAGTSPAVAAQESIAEASRAAADTQVADQLRIAQATATAAGQEIAASDLVYRKAKENYEKTAAAAAAAADVEQRAAARALEAQNNLAEKQYTLARKSAAIEAARIEAEAKQTATARKNLEAKINAEGRAGEAEATAFGKAQRAQEALNKAQEKSNALSAQQREARVAFAEAGDAANAASAARIQALDALQKAERNLATTAKETARVIAEGAAQDATALRALGAVAEDTAAKIARVNAAPTNTAAAGTNEASASLRNRILENRAAAERAAAEDAASATGAIESTVAAEKAKIAASNSAIAAINQERAARRAQLAEAIAAGDETVKALRAEIAEEGKLANAAVAAEKVRIAASRSAIAAINEETLAFKARNEAAGATGPARAVSPIASLNNAAVRQELADTAIAAKEAEKAIEAARKASEVQFSPGSASGIAEFQAISDEARKSAADQVKYNEEVLASARRTATEIATAETAAYAEVTARARAAAAAQVAANKTASDSFAGKSVASITDSIKGVPGDLFGAITTSAKFATIGVVGLGAALAAIGLVNAAKQQAAVVGFTALAAEISGTIDATTGLSVATEGLSEAQQKVIGQNFENTLINLSNNSALAQTAIQDTTQALLALGFNGDQAIGTIRDIGNALAASGKTGGGLNDDLKGIVVAFSQIKGAGRLLAQDLNQITTRIPSAGRVQVYRELGLALKLAGANAKEGTPEFNKFLVTVQKLAKEGKVTSEVAIPAILKALREVPGAAADAATGLDALGRQNLTLTGRFEALKDNVRSALARAFLTPVTGPGGKSLSSSLAEQIGAAIPAITAAIRGAGPALSGFVSSIGGALFKIIPPLFKLISGVFTQISKAVNAINLTGFLDGLGQIGTKGSGASSAMADFGNVLKDVLQISEALVPITVGIIKGFAGFAQAIHPVLQALEPFAFLLRDIARSPVGQTILALGTVFLTARLGVLLFVKALNAAAGAATRAALTMKAFGTESIFAGNAAAEAAAKTKLAARGTAAGGLNAGGAAAGGFTSKLKSLGNAALIVGPLLIAAGEAGHAAGVALDNALNRNAKSIQAAQDHANELAPTYATLAQNLDKLNIPLSDLSNILDDVGLKTLADQFATGQFTDTVSGLINALESQGLSTADVVKKLVSLGISTTDAQDAVKGFKTGIDAANKDLDKLSTNQADAKFRALALQARLGALNLSGLQDHLKGTSDEALAAIGTIGRLGDLLAALPAEQRINVIVTIDTINNEIFKQTGSVPEGGAADAATITKNLESQFGVNSSAGFAAEVKRQAAASRAAASSAGSAAGSGAQSAASKAADKIGAAKQTIIDALKSFAQDVTTQTPKQIRSALNTIRKEFDKLAKLEGVPHIKLDKLIELDSTKLQAFAKQVDLLTKSVEAEKSAITSAFSAGQAFTDISTVAGDLDQAAQSIAGSAADLSKLRIIKPGQDALNTLGKTVAGIQSGLDAVTAGIKTKTAQLQQFAANAAKALKAGLNPETESQLLAGGPTASNLKLAQELAKATPGQIAALNAAQKAADSASAAVAKIAGAVAGPAATIGNQIVDGLIAGLKDAKKLKELEKAMQTLANVLVAEIKKRLKIASPSRVMHAIGEHVAAGLHRGMTSKVSEIAAAANSMAAAAVPTIAPIDLDTLGGLARAEANLKLNAALAPSTLDVRHAIEPGPKDISLREHRDALVAAFGPGRPEPRVYRPTPAPGRGAGPNLNADALARAIRGLR